MKIDELKQAISVLYEIEGDSLLVEEQGSLHSDKDVELICGSLLAVREGTLQVIHLTVKEFLRAIGEPRNPAYAELLVDSRHANITLSHMCLRCVETNCEHPIVDVKDEIARNDIQIQPTTTELIRKERPLAEYASFS